MNIATRTNSVDLTNPKHGDTVLGEELGKWRKKHRYIYHECVKCGKGRWLASYYFNAPHFSGLCYHCSNTRIRKPFRSQNSSWKGGIRIDSMGYRRIRIYPDDPYYPMATKGGSVAEHRLVMAKQLGRCLKVGEVVHHRNKIKGDNRLENLELLPRYTHMCVTHLESEVTRLEEALRECRQSQTARIEALIKYLKVRWTFTEVINPTTDDIHVVFHLPEDWEQGIRQVVE